MAKFNSKWKCYKCKTVGKFEIVGERPTKTYVKCLVCDARGVVDK